MKKRALHVTDIFGFGRVAEAVRRMRELKPCVPKITRIARQQWALHRSHNGKWDQKLIGSDDPTDLPQGSSLREL